MSSNFERALKKALVHEGGNVDHPRDPGGRTSHGVIQRVYDGWRQGQGLPKQDVWLSTPQERAAIYRKQYWDAIQGDRLPAGVAYVVFDGAVNSGPAQSARWLQRALKMNNVDGSIGEATIAAIENHPDHDRLIADICEKRMAFLRALKTFPTFGKGWTRRVDEVRRTGQAWASGSVGPTLTPDIGREKARVSDARQLRALGPADGAAGAGAATTGAAQVINEAKTSLEPIAGSSGAIATILAWLTVAGAIIAIGGLAYRFWAARQNKALEEALS
jgi:lysozyme family protein